MLGRPTAAGIGLDFQTGRKYEISLILVQDIRGSGAQVRHQEGSRFGFVALALEVRN